MLKRRDILFLLFVFGIAISLGILSLAVMGCVPFGNKTLATMDANIQYLDFFAYWRDILTGKSSLFYTFSNLLGGDPISIISYYLLSPFNLLVVFFEKLQLPLFFNIIVLLKWATAATTFSLFVLKRFKSVPYHFVIIFSLGYAFSQYGISQQSNIMWLDGMYMLPLVALGVFYVVNKSDIKLLSIFVGLTIIFNWYSGLINCLFSVIILIFELIYKNQSAIENKLMDTIKSIVNYTFGMLFGIFLSAIVFLPTFISLSSGTRSGVDLNLINFDFLGNPWNIFKNYGIGMTSSLGNAALYCGSLALSIGILIPFLAKRIREKIAYMFLIISSVMILYWNPMYVLFSLLKQVDSYVYRCSYLTIFSLLFCAVATSRLFQKNTTLSLSNFIISEIIIGSLIFYSNYPLSIDNSRNIKITLLLFLLNGIFIIVYLKFMSARRLWIIFLVFISVGELFLNIYQLTSKVYNLEDASKFSKYEKNQEQQIGYIKNKDKSMYRINQTLNRDQLVGGITANYNESLAFNYPSISGYSSSPEVETMTLLNNLGYRSEQDRITVVNTSILSTDSLLGVKYILSPTQIGDLSKLNQFGKINNKYVYENKYRLPISFTWKYMDTNSIKYTNTFEYQNELYTKLLDDDFKLYTPLVYTSESVENGIKYTLTLPKGNYSFYGNIPWKQWMNNCQLLFADNSSIYYAGWLSQGVFSIPTNNSVQTSITVKADSPLAIDNPQFYALNLDRLQQIHDKIISKEATLKVQGTIVTTSVKGDKQNNSLFLSVPYNKNWQVNVNGKNVLVDRFANSLMSIPLENGKNRVVLKYTNPTFMWGGLLTLLGVVGILIKEMYERQRAKKVLC